jgi:hypothetical protein
MSAMIMPVGAADIASDSAEQAMIAAISSEVFNQLPSIVAFSLSRNYAEPAEHEPRYLDWAQALKIQAGRSKVRVGATGISGQELGDRQTLAAGFCSSADTAHLHRKRRRCRSADRHNGSRRAAAASPTARQTLIRPSLEFRPARRETD